MANNNSLKPRISQKTGGTTPKSTPGTAKRKFGIRLPSILEAAARWTLVVVIFVLMMGGLTVKNAKVDEARELNGELASMQAERDHLKEELDLFNDPAWREAYWKWQTKSHKPGEYYIEFVEPGSL